MMFMDECTLHKNQQQVIYTLATFVEFGFRSNETHWQLAIDNLTSVTMNILEELRWRELIAMATEGTPDRIAPPLLTNETLNSQFVYPNDAWKKPITLHCGFDPTADSLH